MTNFSGQECRHMMLMCNGDVNKDGKFVKGMSTLLDKDNCNDAALYYSSVVARQQLTRLPN